MGKYFAGEMKHKNKKIIICKCTLYTLTYCVTCTQYFTLYLFCTLNVCQKPLWHWDNYPVVFCNA